MREFVHAQISAVFDITIDNEVKHVAGLDVEQNGNGTFTLRQDGHCVVFSILGLQDGATIVSRTYQIPLCWMRVGRRLYR